MSDQNHPGPVDHPVSTPSSGASADVLLEVMRHVASPVTIVTVAHEKQRTGATISSFTSVSLSPPLVSFNVMRGSGLYMILQDASHFAINVLHHDQAELAEQFAQPDLYAEQLFASIPLTTDNPPVLSIAPIAITCKIRHRYPAGDHDIIVGEVERINRNPDAAGEPLLYHKRNYKTVDSG